ncbi:hypothetical protein [Duganella sp. LjRoot269]|uniref:hypothetical protein n=1 Tax=Duganella sp. LjRoot269 TaxID=3342305 RepID=UPI003ECD7361
MNFKLLIKVAYISAIIIGGHSAAYAQTSVIVNGEREFCYGDCGGIPPTLNVGYPTVGTSGPGGGNSAAGFDDSTRGTQPLFNRQPGCQREGYFYAEVNALLFAGQPPGLIIMQSFGDPLFSDPGWRKFQVERVYVQWKVETQRNIEWRTQIHYMYNLNTGTFAQVKLKNSYEYGCIGVPKAAGA